MEAILPQYLKTEYKASVSAMGPAVMLPICVNTKKLGENLNITGVECHPAFDHERCSKTK
jgi:hypothetical protein